MSQEIGLELAGVNFRDKRLDERSRNLLAGLAVDPAASVNASFSTWNETIAAYRFFDNPKVTPDRILKPHYDATKDRMAGQSVVLVVQDTTELDFSLHPQSDARCLNKATRFGLYDHTHLALTPEGLPLGVVGAELFDRSVDSLGKSQQRVNLPIEEKESMRWLTGYRLASQLAAECPDTQIVSVADAESDIYDIFVEAASRQADPDQSAAEFIIRSRASRRTPERDPDAGDAAYKKVEDVVRSSAVRSVRAVTLPKTPKRQARTAELEIRAMSVTLKPPHARGSLPEVTCNVVLVTEVNGPGDGTDVEWMLLTTLPVTTIDEILLVIDYYVARWGIEVYFRVLKTGCRVEDMQLETVARAKNCLALYKSIAWRIVWLTHLNRELPESRCDRVFEDDEWKSVWLATQKTAPPATAPTLSKFMSLVASLGGYNNRRTERPPGPQPIWVGLRRMTDLANAWKLFRSPENSCV